MKSWKQWHISANIERIKILASYTQAPHKLVSTGEGRAQVPGERQQQGEEEEEEEEAEEAAGRPAVHLSRRGIFGRHVPPVHPGCQELGVWGGGEGLQLGGWGGPQPRSREHWAQGPSPQLRRRRLPRVSTGHHSLCPSGPGRRKVGGIAAAGRGGVQPAPGRLGSQKAPHHQRIPGSPKGHTPVAGTAARVATRQVHDVMGAAGDVHGLVSGRATRAPAPKQVWLYWAGNEGDGGGPDSDDERGGPEMHP